MLGDRFAESRRRRYLYGRLTAAVQCHNALALPIVGAFGDRDEMLVARADQTDHVPVQQQRMGKPTDEAQRRGEVDNVAGGTR